MKSNAKSVEAPKTAAEHLLCFRTENAISEEAWNARERALAELPGIFDDVKFDDSGVILSDLMSAYMQSSYSALPEKHAIKSRVIKSFRSESLAAGARESDPAYRSKNMKPHILVIASFMNSVHTMHRVFAPSLAELKKRFHVTGLVFTPFASPSDPAINLFHRLIFAPSQPFPFFNQVAQLTRIIRDLAPDAILYADNAMHPFGIALSGLRLAPLQMLLAGHPASSYSPEMDYFACEEFFARGLSDFTERRALVPTNMWRHERHPALASTPKAPREPGPLRIVVPGVVIKLTHPLMLALARIMKELPDAELHITTNATDESFRDYPKIRSDIHNIIPEARVYPRLPYPHFLNLLDQCDLFLNTFPFGGCSTVNDCLARGLPGVSMIGEEYFSLQGPYIMNSYGLPPFNTLARTEREYVARAINLAINRPLRENYAELIREANARGPSIFTNRSDGLADLVTRLLTNAHGSTRSLHAAA